MKTKEEIVANWLPRYTKDVYKRQVYQSIQSQNMEVSAGYIGQPIGKDNKNAFQYTLNGHIKGALCIRCKQYRKDHDKSRVHRLYSCGCSG